MSQSRIDLFKAELADASPDLVGNDDLFRSVLAGCGDCIKVLDLDGKLLFMSEGGKRVMEVDDFAVLKNCPWPGFWAGEGNAHATAAVATARSGETARFRGAANTAKGTPRYWDVQVSPISDASGRPTHLLSISRDITEEWNAAERLREAGDRQKFLTEELQHRVKNMLSSVMAIASRTFRGAPHEAPLRAFSTRLTTLSKAHDVLTASNWDRADIRGIIDGALAPHAIEAGRFVIAGPSIDLDPKQALALALAVNELVTNASKYGALSNTDGIVRIEWWQETSGTPATFNFTWREENGPSVVAPAQQGFGTLVITTLLAQDFGGTVELGYEPAGFVCALKAPLASLPSNTAT